MYIYIYLDIATRTFIYIKYIYLVICSPRRGGASSLCIRFAFATRKLPRPPKPHA